MTKNTEKQNRSYSRRTNCLRPAYNPYPELMRGATLLASKSGFVQVEKEVKKEIVQEKVQHSYTLAQKDGKYIVFLFVGNEYAQKEEFLDEKSAYKFYHSKLN